MFLATSGDQDMYQRGRPLPFAQLHSPGGGGLLGLLKFALWQVGPQLVKGLSLYLIAWCMSSVTMRVNTCALHACLTDGLD